MDLDIDGAIRFPPLQNRYWEHKILNGLWPNPLPAVAEMGRQKETPRSPKPPSRPASRKDRHGRR